MPTSQLPHSLSLVTCVLLGASALASAGSQTAKLTPLGAAAGDLFGAAVGLSGTTAIVGARGDNLATGAALLFDVTSGIQTHELLASDGAAGDRFGISVAISGSTVVVGADQDDDKGNSSGAAYVFDAGTGAQLHKLVPSDGAAEDYFGFTVAVSGTIAIIGAYGDDDQGSRSGSAYLFDTVTGAQLFKLLPTGGLADDFFGYSVGISGARAIAGAFGRDDNGALSGAAYLFDTSTGLQTAKLLPSDDADNEFGVSVAIDGERALVGAWYDGDKGFQAGAAYLFELNPLVETAKIFPGDAATLDHFGFAVALSDGTAILSGHSNDDNGNDSGSAYLFDAATGQELEKLLPEDGTTGDLFGAAVAISGPTTIIGALQSAVPGPGAGAAYLFCAPTVSYCSAGVSTSGCQALLATTGVPSATATSGFFLSAAGVEGQKDGLFFFGTNGRQANSWGNGTSLQCVVPPVMRGGLLTGSGTPGQCDGTLSQDLTARWTAKPAQNPGAGAVVQAQLWYRDPANTSNQTTSLSDAVEFCVRP